MAIAQRRKKVRILRNATMSLQEIAEQLEVPVSVVDSDIHTLGLKTCRALEQEAIAARREKVRVWKEQGMSHEAIARRLGCSPFLITNDMRALGLPTRPRATQAEVQARREKVRALSAQGMTHQAMANRLGLQKTMIASDILALGLQTTRRGKIPRPTPAQIAARRKKVRALRDHGMTHEAMASRLGCGPCTIADDIRALGLPIKSRPALAEVAARREKVRVLKEQGLTYDEMARRLGLARTMIASDLRALGQPRDGRRE